jgi:hypothetical protein
MQTALKQPYRQPAAWFCLAALHACKQDTQMGAWQNPQASYQHTVVAQQMSHSWVDVKNITCNPVARHKRYYKSTGLETNSLAPLHIEYYLPPLLASIDSPTLAQKPGI